MALGFISKLFGRKETEKPRAPAPAMAGTPDLEGFVHYVVRALVDAPDSVEIKVVPGPKAATIQVACDKRDIGKIIGKSGKTIAAIRALVSGAAGRMGQKVNVEVLD